MFCWIRPLNPVASSGCSIGTRVSILVLLDSAPQLLRSSSPRPIRFVSILVLLDSAPQLVVWFGTVDLQLGFNPCSVGFGPSTPSLPTVHDTHSRFQSLFCWIRPLNTVHRTGKDEYRIVSILVLLDSAPQLLPCSWATVEYHGFQSLFCWIRPLNTLITAPVSRHLRFQSLFCWIRPLNLRLHLDGAVGIQVSILVLLDSAPQLEWPGLLQSPNQVSILVLLDSAPQQPAPPLRGHRDQCFNPCSVGFGPSTRLWPCDWSAPSGFNPCSVGFGPSTIRNRTRAASDRRFQSLFCWIRPLNCCWTACTWSAPGFNPCSVGFGPSTALFAHLLLGPQDQVHSCAAVFHASDSPAGGFCPSFTLLAQILPGASHLSSIFSVRSPTECRYFGSSNRDNVPSSGSRGETLLS